MEKKVYDRTHDTLVLYTRDGNQACEDVKKDIVTEVVEKNPTVEFYEIDVDSDFYQNQQTPASVAAKGVTDEELPVVVFYKLGVKAKEHKGEITMVQLNAFVEENKTPDGDEPQGDDGGYEGERGKLTQIHSEEEIEKRIAAGFCVVMCVKECPADKGTLENIRTILPDFPDVRFYYLMVSDPDGLPNMNEFNHFFGNFKWVIARGNSDIVYFESEYADGTPYQGEPYLCVEGPVGAFRDSMVVGAISTRDEDAVDGRRVLTRDELKDFVREAKKTKAPENIRIFEKMEDTEDDKKIIEDNVDGCRGKVALLITLDGVESACYGAGTLAFFYHLAKSYPDMEFVCLKTSVYMDGYNKVLHKYYQKAKDIDSDKAQGIDYKDSYGLAHDILPIVFTFENGTELDFEFRINTGYKSGANIKKTR